MAGEWGWWQQEEMSVIMYLMALENFTNYVQWI